MPFVAAVLIAVNAANAAAPPAPAFFALTPGLANTGVLDWSKPVHAKLYGMATKGLDFNFKGEADQVPLLYHAIQNRAHVCGFSRTIMTIPDDDGTANVVGQNTRTAQDNVMMYQCLYNSVSEDVKKRLVPKVESADIGGITIAALYYKSIISTVRIPRSSFSIGAIK